MGSTKVQLKPLKAEFANCLLHNLRSASSPIPLSADNETLGRNNEEDEGCEGSADERVVRARNRRDRKTVVGRCMLYEFIGTV